jgi:hypothetical protein
LGCGDFVLIVEASDDGLVGLESSLLETKIPQEK